MGSLAIEYDILPPLYPSLSISTRECAIFQLLVDASCKHIIRP